MPAVTAGNIQTVENLLAAYEGESNAHAKYAAFAGKADAEGWHGAASLFRAAARAEQIHAASHARVLRQLGNEAKCVIHPIDVKSTLENLKAARDGELYEIVVMYPDFLAEATAQQNTAAVRTMQFALEAEKTHARLFSQAVNLLEAAKMGAWVSAAKEFYVCPVCGYTSETPEEHERCPICNVLWEKLELIR